MQLFPFTCVRFQVRANGNTYSKKNKGPSEKA